MKKLIRLFALMLAVTVLFSGISVHAASGGALIQDPDLTVSDFNQLTVTVAINQYFTQRKAFLQGQIDEISVALPGITEDESKHVEKLTSAGVTWVDSQIEVTSLTCSDTMADAEVTEVVTYVQEGGSQTESIHHVFRIYNDGTAPVIGADCYKALFSNFISASYVPADMGYSTMALQSSAPCICHVAYGEIGYTTGSDYTKYGEFTGTSGYAWCVSFISWCANEAGVSTSVYPYKATTCTRLRTFYDALGAYFMKGERSPAVGDIMLSHGGGGTEDDIDHAGLVVGKSGNYIYVVNGNSSIDNVREVTYNVNATDIIAYVRPPYPSQTHSYSVLYYSEYYHQQRCVNCGASGSLLTHTYAQASLTSPHVCTGCGHSTTNPPSVIAKVKHIILEE